MRKALSGRFGWTAVFIVATAFLLGGCGGGGGSSTSSTSGTGPPPPAASKKINLSGSFSQPAGKIIGTVEIPVGAARSAKAAVANTSVIAYWVKNGNRTPLNSLSDRTDANGVFNITIDIGTKTNLDVVVEALIAEAGSGGNFRVAFDNLASDVSNVAGNATTTQSADFFLLTPDSALADIDSVVAMLLENGVSMTSIDTKAEVEALVGEVKEAINDCASIETDAAKESCYAESIDTTDLPADTQAALGALETAYGAVINIINVSGAFSQGGGARAAGRGAAAALADTSVIAYAVDDLGRTLLNSSADKTDAAGAFSIAVDIGTQTSLDVVVEALVAEAGSGSNLRVAFDDIAADVSGAAGNETTTQSADFFILAPDNVLADIDAAVAALLENDVALDGIDTKEEVEALVAEVKEAIDNCSGITDDATMKNCYVENIDTTDLPADTQAALSDLEVEYKVDVGSATTAERLYALDKTQSLAAIEKIVALAALGAYDNFDSLFSAIDTASELQEMVTAASYAITSYDSASLSEAAKLVAVKRDILASSAITAFTNNDVTSLLLDIRAALNTTIANDTADLSAQVTNLDILSLLSGYDIIEWMFLEVLTDQGFTREGAIEVFDALVDALGYFGDYSDGVSDMSKMMDSWVTMWDLAAFQVELAKVLQPFDMGDTAKTDDLMRMAHDLQALGSTRAQVEEVLLGYLTVATTAKAMALYDKYYGKTDCGFDMNTRAVTGSNCPTQAEIIDLLETHFEKGLPLLDNTITAIGEWIQSPENDIKLIGIVTGARAAQTIYNKMKESAAYEQELSVAVDMAGVSSKLFELVINVEPYI